MESMGDDCCFAGHAGDASYQPRGAFVRSNDLNIYEVASASSAQRKGLLLYLPDGFGLAQHNLILADKYAEHGYDTFVIDYFEGDPLPVIFMSYTPGTDLGKYTKISAKEKEVIRNIDTVAWNTRHNPDRIWSIMTPFIEALRAKTDPACALYAIGHCFGGKYALSLAKGMVDGVIAFHPAFLKPSDLQGLTKPVFVGCAETDVFTPSLVSDLLPALRASTAPYHLAVYGKTKHGFASRADATDSAASKILWESFHDSLIWLERLKAH